MFISLQPPHTLQQLFKAEISCQNPYRPSFFHVDPVIWQCESRGYFVGSIFCKLNIFNRALKWILLQNRHSCKLCSLSPCWESPAAFTQASCFMLLTFCPLKKIYFVMAIFLFCIISKDLKQNCRCITHRIPLSASSSKRDCIIVEPCLMKLSTCLG